MSPLKTWIQSPAGLRRSVVGAMVLLLVGLVTASVRPLPIAGVSTTYYVRADGTGSCLSWADACPLHQALGAAQSGDSVWVASGVHKPSTVAADRGASFVLQAGRAVYGGFPATGTPTFADRDPAAYVTVLSGDIDNNDTVDASGISTALVGSNSYHVVTTEAGLTSSAVLDGFTITAGMTAGGMSVMEGGGMYLHQGSPALANLRFVKNTAYVGGGGLAIEACDPNMENCTATAPTLDHVVFTSNTTTGIDSDGGGLVVWGEYDNSSTAHPILTDVIFDGNTATRYGGGLALQGAGATLLRATFSGNTATLMGGGLYVSWGEVQLTDAIFSGNSASTGGGAESSSATLSVVDAAFVGNQATGSYPDGEGGGLHVQYSSVTVDNAIFSGNSATRRGGAVSAIAGLGAANMTVTNTTFSGNSAGTSAGLGGGAVSVDDAALVTVRNAIAYGNTPDQLRLFLASAPTLNVDRVVLEGGCPTAWDQVYTTCTNVSTANPLFVNAADPDGADNNLFTADDGLRPATGSPAIDAGNNSYVASGLTTDLAGQPRFIDDPATTDTGSGTAPIVDLGAYEYQGLPATILHVKADAAGTPHDGSTWDRAYTDLQAALTAAQLGDEIWVAAGTYKPTTGTDRSISFALKNNVAIYGGFAGTETDVAGRNPTANVTTLSGDIGTAGQASDNSYHPVAASGVGATAILDGFTITGGFADGVAPADYGGGLVMSAASPTLRNLVIQGNAGVWGGGVANLVGASPTLTNVVVKQNSSSSIGGGLWVQGGSPNLTNVTFLANDSASNGGAVYVSGGSPTLTNVTMAGNHATSLGGGLYNGSGSTTSVTNGIVWGNTAGSAYPSIFPAGTLTVTYSDVEGGFTGTGNINADPKFVSSTDLRLQIGSPAIDAGNNAALPAGLAKDLAGQPRFFNDPATTDTGSGTAPLIDMGAYEFQGPALAVLRVKADATGTPHDGSSWNRAYTDLQAALAAAASGDEIWVAQGTYTPGTSRSDSFVLKNGVAVFGGFAGTETSRAARSWATYVTTLSGNIGDAGVATDNSYHVVRASGVSSSAVLDGFTISGGNANGADPDNDGGGVYSIGSSPTLRNVVITQNAALYGGALYVGGSPSLANAVVRNNTAVYGAGIWIVAGSPVVTNSTFYGNSQSYTAGAAIFVEAGSVTLTNSIVWANSPTTVQVYPTTSATATFSDVGGFSGGGNIEANPLFVNAGAGDLRLQAGSPAINTGSTSAVPAGLTTDLDGNARIVGSSVDMGAYEKQTGSAAPVIGLPSAPITYDASDPATPVDPASTVTDPDSANFDTGALTVDFLANGSADDRLAIANQGSGAGQIGVSGSTVSYAGTAIGTTAGGTGTTPLVVTLNANASVAATQALMRAVTFANVATNPSTLPRTVRFVLSDGDGATSAPATTTVNVTAPTPPTVGSPTSTSITASAAVLGGTVSADGGATVSERGVVYAATSTNSSPQIGGTGVTKVAAVSGGTGTFTVDATALSPSTGYSYAAYAINSAGTSYSTVATFTTLAPVAPPMVGSPTATSIARTTAVLGGTVTAEGGATVTTRGVVYSATDATPTIGEPGVTQMAAAAGGTGTFTVDVTGLTPGTSYSYAAYAINTGGTGYSSVGTFTTLPAATHFSVSAPSSTAVGASISVTVTALDANGDTDTAYKGTVHFTSTDTAGGVVLPADHAFVAGDNGTHTFSATLRTLGSQTITATDTVVTAITGTSATITVTCAAITTMTGLQAIGTNTTTLAGTYCLTTDLDATGVNDFVPIGNGTAGFTGTFDGQGHTIRNLTISGGGTDNVGLFGVVSTLGSVHNLGLENVQVTGAQYVGALVGRNYGSISSSHSTGTVTSSGPGHYTGGLVGDSSGSITSSYSRATLTAGGSDVGGLVGRNSGSVGSSYSSGNVNGSSSLGGLVGQNTGTITSSYSTGSATGNGSQIGGLVGTNGAQSGPNGTITSSYSTGSASGIGQAGGLVGLSWGASSATGSYWDKDTSGLNASAGGSGLTDLQMRQQASFSGWSFASTWGMVDGATYPYLQWQAPVITAVVPAPGATSVAVGANVTVTFNVAMDGSSFTGSTVYLTVAGSDTHVPAALSWDPGSRTLTLNPTDNLVATTYVVTVKGGGSGVKDTGSGILPADGKWSFSTPGAGQASHFTVSAPTSATVGGPFNVTITALDAGERTATGYTGTVHFTLGTADAGAIGLGNYTFTAGDTGVHTFSVTLTKAAAAQTITATDTVTSGITGTSDAIAVAAAAATHFAVSAPSNATAGSSFQVSVTALDANGYTASGYTGTVHFTLGTADAGAIGLGNYTFTAGDNGVHTFSVTLTKAAAAQAITATDTVTSGITGTSGPLAVGAGAATHFAVTAPGNAGKGSAFDVTVTARDANENTATGYTGTVHFTTTDTAGGIVLPANHTFVAGDNGTHTFSATLQTPGNQVITATDTITSGITGTSGTIAVSPCNNVGYTPIASMTELQGIGGTTGSLGGSYCLAADLDATGATLAPIGSLSTPFTGTFDGQSHTIANVTISLPAQFGVGLFAAVGTGGQVKNVGLVDATVSGYASVGGLAGENRGTIIASYSTGSVTGVYGTSNTGGLIGDNIGTVTSSYSAASVNGVSNVGGLTGSNTGTISASHSTGSVSGAGGINTGGLVGYNSGSITTSYNAGAVSGVTSVGGLAGRNASAISSSYNVGNVTGTGNSIGGLVGWNSAASSNISSSYSTGSVSAGGGTSIGGLVGGNSGTVSSTSYWDKDTSGRTTSAGGTGLTDSQMRLQASFTGWSFSTTWGIANGVTYPYLQWQSPVITGASPSADATEVATDATISVTFNAAMDSSTITDGTFYLTLPGSSSHVPATLSWNGTTHTATLTPSTTLTGMAYTATVVGGASGIKDPTGSMLSAGATWGFSTVVHNQAPTDISLSSTMVRESQPSGTTVGTFSTTDANPDDTFTYSLVAGTGSTDNASFTIAGNTLKTAAVFDYETKPSYSIRVRTTDAGSLWAEKVLTITVQKTVAFSNTGVITTYDKPNDSCSATDWQVGNPYPATISVSGFAGSVSKVTVTIGAFEHPVPRDVDLVVVGPTGQAVMLMSDAGLDGVFAPGITLTFDDSAAAPLPGSGTLAGGTYQPTNYDIASPCGDFFPSPGPTSWASVLSALNGTNPNGTWKLYALDDDFNYFGGSIDGGWSLTISTSETPILASGSASPTSAAQNATSLLSVTVTPGTNPTSTGLAVNADLSAIGGSASQSFYDDASHGDVTAGDHVFSFQAGLVSAAPGAKSLPFTASDAQGRSAGGSVALTVTAPTGIQTYTVNSTNDVNDGVCDATHCSLREAILAANAHANDAGGVDVINFNIAGSGVQTIAPAAILPAITNPVAINGYTQPGAATATSTTVASLKVVIDGVNAGSSANGLLLDAGSGGSTIKGLVIGRFSSSAIRIETSGNAIEGNYLGIDAAGTTAMPNGQHGVQIAYDASATNDNMIGGATPAQRNVVSGNTNYGIYVMYGSGNHITGNYIGTNAAGTAAVPNVRGVAVTAAGNTVGGSAPGQGNVVSGNTGATYNTPTGIWVSAAATVQGNLVGVAADGSTALGNASGIWVASVGSTIGGTGAGEANVVAYNTGPGVAVGRTSGTEPTGNRIEGNSIYGNGSLGIDLVVGTYPTQTYGVTANDTGDADIGANSFQNFPALTSATVTGPSALVVAGTIDTTASSTFHLEFFSSPTATCDASGYGEGKTYLGSSTVTTGSNGTGTISATLAATVTVGDVITATATDPSGNTSEFSACVTAASPNASPVMTTSAGSTTYTENGAATAVDSGVVVSDADSTSLGGATIQITGGYQSGADVLAFTDTASITASWNATTGKLTLSGTATVADYQVALRAVTYASSSDNPSTSDRTVTFVATDSDGAASTGATKTIAVTPVNDAPTDISLSTSAVAENAASGTIVGTLTSTDADSTSFTYSLVAGTGSTDNASFTIDGASLKTAASFDYETTSSSSIRVQTSDGALTYEKVFTITVTNVNEAPSDIALSATSVAENQAIGTTVGTLSTTDPDAGDSFTYALVTGTGSTDNASFSIDGSYLKTAAIFNYEATSSYSIRVRTTDGGSATYEKVFTITVTNVNEAPTDIALSASTVAENQAAGTVVGTLSTTDPDAGGSFTYSLVAGTGDTDNGSFTITGNSLKTAAAFNYETKSSYNIRIETSDGTLTNQEAFTITVTNANEAPTDIALSNNIVAENQPSGTTVGTFSTTDPDGGAFVPVSIGPVFTYTLVSGTGDTDNGSFTIVGSTLQTAASLNFEAKSSYSIRVRTTDGGALWFEKVFTISVSNANEAPTDISLSASSVAENQPSGTTVGTLSTTDPDAGGSFTYSLVTGEGSTDNGSFSITGSTLKTGAMFDAETKSSYAIRVQTSDGSLTFEKAFTITVTSLNEAPTDISLSASSVAENQASGTVVGTLSTTDPDSGDSFTYSLVSGEGSTDNGSFTITGDSLKTAASFNVETKSSYSIRIQTSDGTLSYAEAFTITVTNVNETPTSVSLSNDIVAENQPVGTVVGAFSTTDPDAADSFTYTLVSGSGSADNGKFTIDGSSLKTALVFDKETSGGFAIRVRSTDAGSLSTEQTFTINLADVNEAPTDLSLSPTTVAENQPAGTTVGTLSTTDPDAGDSFTYALVTGTSSTDNGSFTIDGDSLKTAASFNFESQASYSIRVQVADSGDLTFAKALTITVSNVNEAPTISDVANQNIVVNNATGALAVTIGDPETAAAGLTLGGTSDNQALVPDANIVIGGSGANRTVAVTPATDQTGTATITLTVGDVELTATDTFVVTVGIGQPPKVTTQPGSQTITETRNATFTAEGVGAPTPTVHWEISTNRGKTWTDLANDVGGVSGADTDTLFLSGVTREMSGYRYRAVFTNQNGTVASDAATLTIKAIATTKPTKIGTTLTVVSDGNPSTDGAVTLTATVTPMSGTGTPTGTVTFLEGRTVLGEAALVGGTASITLAAELRLPGGEHEITARYSGDLSYNPSTSGVYHQVVGTTTTDVAITLSGQETTPPGGQPTITWTIVVWNLGDELASSVQVKTTVDNATKLAAIRAAEGITWVTKGRTTTVLVGDLAAGATTTIEIDAVLGRVPRVDVTIPATVTVSTASLDMNPSNDTSTAEVTISPVVLLEPTGETSLVIVTETPLLSTSPRRRRRPYRAWRRRSPARILRALTGSRLAR